MDFLTGFLIFALGWGGCYFRSLIWGWVLDGAAWVWGKVNK